jgi:hypothetical protein
MNYYLYEQQQTMGPFSKDQLLELFAQGKLDGATPCCREGASEWQTVSILAGSPETGAAVSASPILPTIYQANRYTLRRKVLTLFGASFHVFAPDGTVIFFSRQKAFKLREDIRIYTNEAMDQEILSIRARQVLDFSAAYDVVDTQTQSKLGALRRKGFSSLIRDAWLVLDAEDREIGQIMEDSMALALIRRFLVALIPQKFHLTVGGKTAVHFQQQFNPFIYKLEIEFAADAGIDKRLALAAAVLLAAIEGRQD